MVMMKKSLKTRWLDDHNHGGMLKEKELRKNKRSLSRRRGR